MTPRRAPRDPAAGVTLVEVLVALALSALIGVAGFSVLDQVIRVQNGVEDRLQRLAQIQRAMHLVSQDFMRAAPDSVGAADGAVAFRRTAGDGEMAVRYALEDATLVRRVSGSGAPARQTLLSGVSAIGWRFLDQDAGWLEAWPPPGYQRAPSNPAAVTLDLALTGPGLAGALRRIAVLPADFDR